MLDMTDDRECRYIKEGENEFSEESSERIQPSAGALALAVATGTGTGTGTGATTTDPQRQSALVTYLAVAAHGRRIAADGTNLNNASTGRNRNELFGLGAPSSITSGNATAGHSVASDENGFLSRSGLNASEILALQQSVLNQRNVAHTSALDPSWSSSGEINSTLRHPQLSYYTFPSGLTVPVSALAGLDFPTDISALQNTRAHLQMSAMGAEVSLSPTESSLLNADVSMDTLSLLRREIANAHSAAASSMSFSDPFARIAPDNAASSYLGYLTMRNNMDSVSGHFGLRNEASIYPTNNIFGNNDVDSFLARRNLLSSSARGHLFQPHQQQQHHNQEHNQYQQQQHQFNHHDLFPRGPMSTTDFFAGYPHSLGRNESINLLTGQGFGDDSSPGNVPHIQVPLSDRLLSRSSGIDSFLGSHTEGKEETKDTTRSLEERKVAEPYRLSVSWDELVENSTLTIPELRGVISDVHFAVLAQMRLCKLTHEDRVSLYKTRDIGFPGICCKHCGGVPGFGRYFPGSVTSLVNGNICKSIIKHLSDECRECPAGVRDSILKLDLQDKLLPFHYRRGSRRTFFSSVWDKIQERCSDEEVVSVQGVVGPTLSTVKPATLDQQIDIDEIPWGKILEGSEVVFTSDRHLVPDTIFAATAQTKPCQVTEGDRVGRCKDHKLGSMGLCCKHCEGKVGAFGRYFPSNLHTFAQVEVCKQIVRHISRKCHSCPVEIREAIFKLQKKENAQAFKRYPSRMVFFRRVWYRFHYGDKPDVAAHDGVSDAEDGKPSAAGTDTIPVEDIQWQDLLQESKLVSIEDQGLISDSQFTALAQMDRCQLTVADRIGYNKNRDVGFIGMCCRFCGGRPGFGRYFPDTVRNLEKTSARDTIVSHISLFCQHCPIDVRNSLLSLKRIESSRDGSANMKALIYGSGKLFFRRVWSRLHSELVAYDVIDDSAKIEKGALGMTKRKSSGGSSAGEATDADIDIEGKLREGAIDKQASVPASTKVSKRPRRDSSETTRR